MDNRMGDLAPAEYFRRLNRLRSMGFANDIAADALHDAEFDVERAIQNLIEDNPFPTEEDVESTSTPKRPDVPLFSSPSDTRRRTPTPRNWDMPPRLSRQDARVQDRPASPTQTPLPPSPPLDATHPTGGHGQAPDLEEDWEGWSDFDSSSVSTPDLNGVGPSPFEKRPLASHEFLSEGKKRKSSIQAWLATMRLDDDESAGPSLDKTKPSPKRKQTPPPESSESTPKKNRVKRRNLRVGIVGAGFTGLVLAHGLRGYKGIDDERPPPEKWQQSAVHDWSVSVPERKDFLTPLKRLLPLDVFKAVKEACSVAPVLTQGLYPRPIPCLDAETGDALFYSEVPDLCRFRGLRLLGALSEDITVQWNLSLVSLQPSEDDDEMHLFFEPGHLCYKVDVVIGADGADSLVRRLLVENYAVVDPEPQNTEYVEEVTYMLRVKSKDGTDTAQKFHPIQTMASDKDGLSTLAVHQWQVDPSERAQELIQISRISAPPGDPLKGLRLDKEAARQYMLESICKSSLRNLQPWKTYIDDMEEPDWHGNFKVQKLRFWNPLKFDNLGGKATLAGDAAHVMFPFGGRSLIHAVQDAERLVIAVARMPRPGTMHLKGRLSSQEQLLNEYDENLRARGNTATRLTREEAEQSVNQAVIREALNRDPTKSPVSIYQ